MATTNDASVTSTPTPKERSRDLARQLASQFAGAHGEFFEAHADELDRQIAFDAARAAGNEKAAAVAAIVAGATTGQPSGSSTSGAGAVPGSVGK